MHAPKSCKKLIAFFFSKIEKCDTDYVKDCHIHYEKGTRLKPVEVCRENLIRDCDAVGPEVCTKEQTSGNSLVGKMAIP